MRLIRLVSVCAIAGLLAACGTPHAASVAGGEAHALKGPDFAVKGATDFDQRWIDETTEAGIAALGWPRPAQRPPEWDKPLAKGNAMTDAEVRAAVAKSPTKKKRWRARVRGLFHRHPKEVEGG